MGPEYRSAGDTVLTSDQHVLYGTIALGWRTGACPADLLQDLDGDSR